jgi:hypothetical protein
MPISSKDLLIIITVSLLLLGVIAAAIGFSMAALTGPKLSELQPSISLTETTLTETDTPLEVLASATFSSIPTSSPQAPRITSTPQPTFTIAITTTASSEIIVRYGESLYPVCRRHCTGLWSLNEVPPSLIRYAQTVSQMNSIPWNNGHPLVYAGQQLKMPPCPAP